MGLLYAFSIRIMFFGIRVAALFKHKASLLVQGQKLTRETLLRLETKSGVRHWFHCASLGEFEQGRPLMEALKRQDPGCEIILTFFSPSGYEVRKDFELAFAVLYLLPDTASNARFFLNSVRPDKVYFIKYEFWPAHMRAIIESGIPLYSVCCRFRPEQRFFQWWGGFFRQSLRSVSIFFHQDQASLTLLEKAGISGNSHVVGDMRFDRVAVTADDFSPLDPVTTFAGSAPLLVVGSSWPAEEEIVKMYLKLTAQTSRVVLAPHDVSEVRLKHIERLLPGLTVRYSVYAQTGGTSARVLLVDSIGLLGKIYRQASFSLVGGGFSGKLHNVLEPAGCGVSVVFGPRIQRFPEAQGLVAAGGAWTFVSTQSAAEWLVRLSEEEDMRNGSGIKAKAFVSENQGATRRIMTILNA